MNKISFHRGSTCFNIKYFKNSVYVILLFILQQNKKRNNTCWRLFNMFFQTRARQGFEIIICIVLIKLSYDFDQTDPEMYWYWQENIQFKMKFTWIMIKVISIFIYLKIAILRQSWFQFFMNFTIFRLGSRN